MSGCCGPRVDLLTADAEFARASRAQGHRRAGPVPVGMPAATGLQLVDLPGGKFRMGDDSGRGFVEDGEGPARQVALDPFRIAATTVTNDRFAAFVDATGHVTGAERHGWSYVFDGLLPEAARSAVVRGQVVGTPWWLPVRGATWSAPLGPGSSLNGLKDHPVVHVSWQDAQAFCAWSGTRLPTEAEWEFAARGGLDQAIFPWGDELEPAGTHRCNVWQGHFPDENLALDGYVGTAPVDAFKTNGHGLYDTAGNVWEWCADWWSPSWHVQARPETRRNPTGPPAGRDRVIRGGSYLCHDSYCTRYRVAARTSNSPGSTAGHMGFRVATDSAAA